MPNHNRICKDGFFSYVFIKGDNVIDNGRNMKIQSLKSSNTKIKGKTRVLGDVIVKGSIIY